MDLLVVIIFILTVIDILVGIALIKQRKGDQLLKVKVDELSFRNGILQQTIEMLISQGDIAQNTIRLLEDIKNQLAAENKILNARIIELEKVLQDMQDSSLMDSYDREREELNRQFPKD